MVSMARNVLVSWLLCRWSQAAAFSCGSSGSWSCKGICLPGTPGAALRICKARDISWVSICPSVHCCGAGEGGGLTCRALQSRVTLSPGAPGLQQAPCEHGGDLPGSFPWRWWVGERPSVLGASVHPGSVPPPPECPGAALRLCVLSHYRALSVVSLAYYNTNK